MEDSTLIKLFALTGLTVIECVALYLGVNGALFSLVVAGIAGIAGYQIGVERTKR